MFMTIPALRDGPILLCTLDVLSSDHLVNGYQAAVYPPGGTIVHHSKWFIRGGNLRINLRSLSK